MYILLPSVVLLFSLVQGLSCSGVLNSPNPVASDVSVSSNCQISSIGVTGSIKIGPSASFSTTGQVTISNSISATQAGNINLGGNLSVSGSVMVNSAKSVTVGAMVTLASLTVSDATTVNILGTVGTLSVSNVANLKLSGTTSSVMIAGNGQVSINGGKILNGGLMRSSGVGDTTICGGLIFGGVQMTQVEGFLSIVASTGCPPSSIDGTISVNGGVGNVFIQGAQLVASDVLIAKRTGNVNLLQLSVSDVSIELITGSVSISSMADSDFTATAISGPINVNKFVTMGDFKIINAGSDVSIVESDFGNEVLNIENPVGTVTLTNNKNVGLSVKGAPKVTAIGNMARTAEFESNGPLILKNNDFSMSLVCVENTSVQGMNNKFTFADGQCTGLP